MALARFDLDLLLRLVRERSGIVLGTDKEYLLEARLTPIVRQHALGTLEGLCRQLRSTSESGLHRQVVEAMTTNETLFFRDHHPFETLVRVVLPDLMTRRQASRKLAIWSAACSTGQEPYSVAMAIREHLPSLLAWELKIVATDLASEVLARARSGRFSALEVGRGLPKPLQDRYFVPVGNDWQLRDEVLRMVEFRPQNLLEPFGPAGSLDVVMLRNVLIYFDLPTKREILAKVRRVLAPDGYLFLGGTETTVNLDDRFACLPQDRGGVYRPRAWVEGKAKTVTT